MPVDFDKLKEHYDGDIEIIAQLIEIFESSYPESFNALKTALNASDYKSVHLHAHTIKGMLSNFFAEDLRSVAFELEQFGSSESVPNNYEQYLNKLEVGVPNMILEIKKM